MSKFKVSTTEMGRQLLLSNLEVRNALLNNDFTIVVELEDGILDNGEVDLTHVRFVFRLNDYEIYRNVDKVEDAVRDIHKFCGIK